MTPALPVVADGRRRLVNVHVLAMPIDRAECHRKIFQAVHNSWLQRFSTHLLSRTCGSSFLASMSYRPADHMSCRGHNVEMMVRMVLHPCVHDGNAVHEC